MGLATSYEVDNDRRFRNALRRALLVTDDLQLPLNLIAKDFYKSERAIFKLKSPGLYPDLSEKYKPAKRRAVGFIYPILKRGGKLEKSMTNPKSKGSINHIVNKQALILGTRVKNKKGVFYPAFLQDGTSKMPARKFLFIGPEAPRFAKGPLAGRPERWFNILNEFIFQKLAQQGWDVGLPTDKIPPLKTTKGPG